MSLQSVKTKSAGLVSSTDTTRDSFVTNLANIPSCIKKLENQLYIVKGFLFKENSRKFKVVFKATEDIVLYGIDLSEVSANEGVTISFCRRDPNGNFGLIDLEKFPRVGASSSEIAGTCIRSGDTFVFNISWGEHQLNDWV